MLILRGLSALLLGAPVVAVGTPLLSSGVLPAWRSRGQISDIDIFNASALGDYIDSYRAQHVLQPRIQAERVKLKSKEALVRRKDAPARKELGARDATCPRAPTICAGQGKADGLACSGCSSCCPDGAGGFHCCQQGFTCCVARNGVGSCCPSRGAVCGDDGCKLLPARQLLTQTVFATATIIQTVTAAAGTQTAVVVETVAQTLSFLNPALGTQTSIVTMTAKRRRRDISAPETALAGIPSAPAVRRGAQPTVTLYPVSAYDALETHLVRLGVEVKRQDAPVASDTVTVTTTTTIDITTTVTVPETVTVTTTVTNTVFVTVTVAPSATSTVFTTTTITIAPGGQTTIPGGGTPPNTASAPGSAIGSSAIGSSAIGSSAIGTSGTGSSAIVPSNNPSGTEIPPAPPASGTATAAPPPPTGGTTVVPPSNTAVPPATGSTALTPPVSSNTATTQSSAQSGNPASMSGSTISTPTSSGTPNPSPFPGSPFSSNMIAGIVVGIILGLFLLLLIAFLIRLCIVRRRRVRMAKEHQAMSSTAADVVGAGAVGVGAGGGLGRSGSTQQGQRSETSSGPMPEGEVRIVIRPAPKRRTQSSGLLPSVNVGQAVTTGGGGSGDYSSRTDSSAAWPRPPGYQGRTYSFFVEESGTTTPQQDPNQWSVASEFGSTSARSGGQGSAPGGSNLPQRPPPAGMYGNGNNRTNGGGTNYSYDPEEDDDLGARPVGRGRGNGGGGGGGGGYLNVGRALSPWNAI